MKPIYSCTAAMLMVLAGAALFRPHTFKADSGSATTANSTAAPVASAAQKIHLAENYGKLPLTFEANQGQTDGRVKFLSRRHGYALFLTGDGAVLTLGRASHNANRKSQKAKVTTRLAASGTSPDMAGRSARAGLKSGAATSLDKSTPANRAWTTDTVLRMKLVGADASASVTGVGELPGRSNYFIGDDPKKWRTNVPNYAKVRYKAVYPGVDLVYYGNQGQLEADFVVAPGADPSAIVLDVGAVREPPTVAAVSDHRTAVGTPPLQKREHRDASLQIVADGDLVIKAECCDVRFHKPVVYQEQSTANSSPSTVSGEKRNAKLHNRQFVDAHFVVASNQIQFALGPYDHTKPLVIDPVLSYSTYLGGSGNDQANGIAIDSSGNAYVVGLTESIDFPTADPLQANPNGGSDAFVAKLNPDGSAFVYSTYLGGSGGDQANGIAVDFSGGAYLTGLTSSPDFPVMNALQASLKGLDDAFVAKLSADGSALVYSTYLGGSDYDYASGIALDSTGDAYLIGTTGSQDFPTVNAIQPHQKSSSCRVPGGIYNPCPSAFVTELNADASALIYSTYLGGTEPDYGNGIAVDSTGSAYVVGQTWSSDFPVVNPLQSFYPLASPFVAKLSPAGAALVYSTYVEGSPLCGGVCVDTGLGIAVDTAGNAYVTGGTGGVNEVFIAKLNPAASALVYSSFLGGGTGNSVAVDAAGNAYVAWSGPAVTAMNAAGSANLYSFTMGNHAGGAKGIAVDSSGNAYVAGITNSTSYPTVNPIQASYGGGSFDAFVAKLSLLNSTANLSPTSLSFGSAVVGTTSAVRTVSLTNAGEQDLHVSSIVASGDFALASTTTSCPYSGGALLPHGRCTIDVTFTPATTGSRTGTVALTDDASGSPQTINLTGTGALATSLMPTSLGFGNVVEGTTSAGKTITLTNNQTVALTNISVGIAGSNDYAQTNTCGSSIGARQKCTITVTFAPTISGTDNATLSISDSAPNSPQTAALTGSGVKPVTLAPTALAFGSLAEGNSSSGKTITVTNSQKVALTGITITTTGADYTQTNTCGTSIAAGQKCTITVSFIPSIIGADNATLSISDSAANSPQTAALTGTGTAPVTLTPTGTTYASQNVGTTSAAKTFTITNNLNATLNSISISTTGDFAVASTTCGTSLASKGKCTVNAVFKPTATGTRTGTLNISDSAGNSPQTSQLTGTGK